MNDVFLSIKEFAKMAKVSPQAVYKRLDKDLKEYFKVIDGKKSIKIEALKQFEVQPEFKPTIQPVDNHFKPYIQPVDNRFSTTLNPEKTRNTAISDPVNLNESFQPVDNHFKPNVKPVDNQLTTRLNQTLKILSDQLFEKDKQISELNERLKEANELNRNNQILIGRQQEKTKQIEEINQTISPVKKFFWDRFRKGV
jgi:hypothetical protein